MKLPSFFRPKPDPSAAGRALGAIAHQDYRRRVRAVAYQMCIDMGRPIPKEMEGWK